MAAEAGKGSKPRPFSVSKEDFDSSFDRIFGKKKKSDAEKFDEAIMKNEYYEEETMQVRVAEEGKKFGSCGCGRSPTGDCIGWHGLNAEQLKEAQTKYKAEHPEVHIQIED